MAHFFLKKKKILVKAKQFKTTNKKNQYSSKPRKKQI